MTRLKSSSVLVLIPLTVAAVSLGQNNRERDNRGRGFPPDTRMESRQGYPGGTDVIAHKFVSKATNLMCISVEHHPRQDDDGAACLLRFQDGTKQTVNFQETTQAKSDGEVYLEFLGDKPTRCVVGWY